MRNVLRELSRADSMLRVNKFEPVRIEVYNLFKEFVLGGNYMTYVQKDLFLENVLECDSVIASKLGVSEEAVRKIKSKMSQIVYSKLGYDVIDKILFGSMQELKSCKEAITLADFNVSSKDLFPMELLSFIKNQSDSAESSDSSFDFDDLRNELSLLKSLSLKNMKISVMDCDINKLVFVLKKLDNASFDSELDSKILKSILF